MASPAHIDLEDLPLDAFELTSAGMEVEHLTAGHGMDEAGSFCNTCCCQRVFCFCI